MEITLCYTGQILREQLCLLENTISDFEVIVYHLDELIAIIEAAEDLAVKGRKALSGYQKELSLLQGMKGKSTKKKGENLWSMQTIPLKIEVKNDVVKIIMFPLMKNLSAKTKEYISLLLSTGIQEYFTQYPEKKPHFVGKSCVLVINSLYAEPAQIRDNDSIEVAAIINGLKSFFLQDDDGLHLKIYRTGELSQRQETEILLMTEQNFGIWILQKSV